MELLTCAFVFISFLYAPAYGDVRPDMLDTSVFNQAKPIGECMACKLFVESFKKGLERTARGKYEGGDAAWEEEKLKKSYLRSEIRLIDIQDKLCQEEPKYKVHCHNIAEKAEELIEKWWTEHLDDDYNLYNHICIENLLLCCPEHHFGKDCTPCPGDHQNICSGNGKCRGDGTRKGNGTCLCNSGYRGDNCNQCLAGYYMSNVDDRIKCLPCDRACLDNCRGESPKDCVACKPGYVFESDEGCIDINECEDVSKCRSNQFCVNKEGSYACFACDNACESCYGDGPDLCRKCSEGFVKKGEICAPERENEDNSDQLTTARHLTYVGLLIATGILLPKSSYIGIGVGIMVISYIIGAEYYCMLNGHAGLVNLKEFDLLQLFNV